MNARTVHCACPHDCPDTCAIRVTVEDGVATRLQGDPAHPPTDGALCTKVARYMVPKSIDFTDALPRLPTGKLYKHALRARYLAQQQ